MGERAARRVQPGPSPPGGPAGQPAAGGRRTSTIARFTLAGKRTGSWDLPGKCDGLTADPANGRLIATVNEDGNSSLYTLAPATGSLRHYTYKTLTHGGGTDSISIVAGQILVAASAPTPAADGKTFTKPALYKLTLAGTTATTTPVLAGNATAIDAVTGKASTLNLSDPGSTETVPAGTARFAGDLLLDSQGDSQQVYLARPGTAQQKAVVLNLGTQVNDTAFASAATGTLYVTDNANNSLVAIKGRFTPGQAMVAAPADSSVHGFVGRLGLATGHIAPFAVGVRQPRRPAVHDGSLNRQRPAGGPFANSPGARQQQHVPLRHPQGSSSGSRLSGQFLKLAPLHGYPAALKAGASARPDGGSLEIRMRQGGGGHMAGAEAELDMQVLVSGRPDPPDALSGFYVLSGHNEHGGTDARSKCG